MVDAKSGEVKTFEDLQQFATEQRLRETLAPKVRELSERVVNLRCQQQRDSPELIKDMHGHDIEFYKELLYRINFGDLKDKPDQALAEVAGLGV
jgi:hypothetical protein